MANFPAGSEGLNPEPAKPSFTKYWKRSKEQQALKNLTFVPSSLEQPPAKGKQSAAATAQTKSQARRQQVRRAQIQHRQRKANYTQKLEEDANKLREDIAQVEQDILKLRKANDAMRYNLVLRGQAHSPANASMATITAAPSSAATPSPIYAPTTASPMESSLSAHACSPDYTVTLDMSEDLGHPIWQVSRPSPLSSSMSAAGIYSPHAATTPATTVTQSTNIGDAGTAEMDLSDQQTEQVVNFILALEHQCWDHTHVVHDAPLHNPEPTISPEPSEWDYDHDDQESGHLLTATALALRTAPDDLQRMIDELQHELQSEGRHESQPPPSWREKPLPPLPGQTPETTATATAAAESSSSPAFYKPQPPADSTNFTANNTPAQQLQSQFHWPARSLTLASLRELAAMLNPPGAELAPVQAWFEIARRYGPGVTTNAGVLDQLRRELGPVTKCVRFGAAVRREIFEEIVGRVLGTAASNASNTSPGVRQQPVQPQQQDVMMEGVGAEFSDFWRFEDWGWDWEAGGGWGGPAQGVANGDSEMMMGDGGGVDENDDGESSKNGGKGRLLRRFVNSALGKGDAGGGGGSAAA